MYGGYPYSVSGKLSKKCCQKEKKLSKKCWVRKKKSVGAKNVESERKKVSESSPPPPPPPPPPTHQLFLTCATFGGGGLFFLFLFFACHRGLWCTIGTPTLCLENWAKNVESEKNKCRSPPPPPPPPIELHGCAGLPCVRTCTLNALQPRRRIVSARALLGRSLAWLDLLRFPITFRVMSAITTRDRSERLHR